MLTLLQFFDLDPSRRKENSQISDYNAEQNLNNLTLNRGV